MNGLSRASGAPVPITFAGKKLLLDPLGLRDFGTIENYMLDARPNPLEVVAATVQKFDDSGNHKLAEKLLERAYEDAKKNNKIPPEEVAAWIDTVEGVGFTIWLSLSKRYGSEYPMELCMDIVQQLAEDNIEGLEKLKEQRDMASTLDEAGNSTGPTLNVESPSGQDLKMNPKQTTETQRKRGRKRRR